MSPRKPNKALAEHHIRRMVAEGLVRLVISDRTDCLVWFGIIYFLSEGCKACIRPLYENFLAGNLPLSHKFILKAWAERRGRSAHIADLFKRTPLWKTIIVGQKGQYWLQVPEDVLERFRSDDEARNRVA